MAGRAIAGDASAVVLPKGSGGDDNSNVDGDIGGNFGAKGSSDFSCGGGGSGSCDNNNGGGSNTVTVAGTYNNQLNMAAEVTVGNNDNNNGNSKGDSVDDNDDYNSGGVGSGGGGGVNNGGAHQLSTAALRGSCQLLPPTFATPTVGLLLHCCPPPTIIVTRCMLSCNCRLSCHRPLLLPIVNLSPQVVSSPAAARLYLIRRWLVVVSLSAPRYCQMLLKHSQIRRAYTHCHVGWKSRIRKIFSPAK